mgnify:CR=1 FL=1
MVTERLLRPDDLEELRGRSLDEHAVRIAVAGPRHERAPADHVRHDDLHAHAVDGVAKPVFVHRKGATRALGRGHADLPPALRDTIRAWELVPDTASAVGMPPM